MTVLPPLDLPDGRRIAFRPSAQTDFTWFAALHRAAMRPHVERALGVWEQAAQEARLRKHFDAEPPFLILENGVPLGTIGVTDQDEVLFVNQLYLPPDRHGQGLGGAVMRLVLAHAAERGMGVTLKVLKGSAARRFYERLGFILVGEDTWQDHLAWSPRS